MKIKIHNIEDFIIRFNSENIVKSGGTKIIINDDCYRGARCLILNNDKLLLLAFKNGILGIIGQVEVHKIVRMSYIDDFNNFIVFGDIEFKRW